VSDLRIPIGGGTYVAGHFANRHGLIAGATGTGKTVTLMKLAEGFSAAGVSTFVVDAKGDLSALARSTPARFLDVFGEHGEPARLSMERLGPELLSRVLGLSDAQAGVLDVLFSYAQAHGLAVHTISDLNAIIRQVRADAEQVREQFGHFTPTTLAAIGRAVLRLEREGGRQAFDSESFDFLRLFGERQDGTTADGRGRVSILMAERLMRSPSLYGAFMIYLLQDVFERMPEAGDLERPRLVLFIDEAHLLFQDCPPALLQRIERTMRLIRSKGVGVYFVTQSPADIPPNVVGQLGNRIQHALRGATPADARAVRAAADSLPAGPRFDAAAAIGKLGIGQALVSTIGPSGEPNLVEVVRVDLPRCPLGALLPAERPPGPRAAGSAAAPVNRPAASGVHPLFAAAVVALVAGAAGVGLYYWWKFALAALLALFLFMRRVARF
jgi:DNA helicase HerA-like ATPase